MRAAYGNEFGRQCRHAVDHLAGAAARHSFTGHAHARRFSLLPTHPLAREGRPLQARMALQT